MSAALSRFRPFDAATTVLAPDGLLLVEVPDPESRLADLLGAFWPPWGQPQHLHFLTADNLAALLEERGYEVVSVVRGPARVSMDFRGAVTEATNAVHPAVAVPWVPRPSTAARARRAAALAAGGPALAAGLAIELAPWPLGGRFGTSKTPTGCWPGARARPRHPARTRPTGVLASRVSIVRVRPWPGAVCPTRRRSSTGEAGVATATARR